MSQGQDSLRATDTIYMFPLMERYNLCVVLVSLMPPSPAVLLADLQWTSSDEHTCSRMKTTSPYGYAGSLRGTCPTSAQTSNWHSETQISSLEFSPSCHHEESEFNSLSPKETHTLDYENVGLISNNIFYSLECYLRIICCSNESLHRSI